MNNEVLCSRCKAASYIRYICPLFVSPRARACITTASCNQHSLDFFEDGALLLTLLVKGRQQRGANIIIDTPPTIGGSAVQQGYIRYSHSQFWKE